MPFPKVLPDTQLLNKVYFKNNNKAKRKISKKFRFICSTFSQNFQKSNVSYKFSQNFNIFQQIVLNSYLFYNLL